MSRSALTAFSLQSAILGFGVFRVLRGWQAMQGYTIGENVITQTTAVATATMPLAAGEFQAGVCLAEASGLTACSRQSGRQPCLVEQAVPRFIPAASCQRPLRATFLYQCPQAAILVAGFVGVIPALSIMTPAQNPPDGPLRLSWGQLILWALALAFLGVFMAVPLRVQTILKEKLRCAPALSGFQSCIDSLLLEYTPVYQLYAPRCSRQHGLLMERSMCNMQPCCQLFAKGCCSNSCATLCCRFPSGTATANVIRTLHGLAPLKDDQDGAGGTANYCETVTGQ